MVRYEGKRLALLTERYTSSRVSRHREKLLRHRIRRTQRVRDADRVQLLIRLIKRGHDNRNEHGKEPRTNFVASCLAALSSV